MGNMYLLDLSISPIRGSGITNTPSDSEALADIGLLSNAFVEPLAWWTLQKNVFIRIILKYTHFNKVSRYKMGLYMTNYNVFIFEWIQIIFWILEKIKLLIRQKINDQQKKYNLMKKNLFYHNLTVRNITNYVQVLVMSGNKK